MAGDMSALSVVSPRGEARLSRLNLTLWHRGEQMTVRFDPAAEGGTQVTISGAVTNSKQATAADPEHWSEALEGASSA
jgi:hypothetical protein